MKKLTGLVRQHWPTLLVAVGVMVLAASHFGALAGLGSGFLIIGAVSTTQDTIKLLIAWGFLDAAGGLKPNVLAKTADYTILAASDPSSTLFTNRGAAGTIVFTLPAPVPSLAGVYYDFFTIVAQIIAVKTATADTLITHADATADDLRTLAAIGVGLRVQCDGTSWIAQQTSGVPAAAFAQTAGVTT